ncbi:DUF4255 domain-containing protein [Acaryochloris marina NIES-2412]|uniref:DUF4255 domain-containing protein n=1 Tax=Acaryochloris marina TaxID=155978 RepID=UPI0040599842
MSNFLAIATITAVLQRTLQATIQEDVEGARVTTLRPADIGKGTPVSGVNIYLYQTSLNTAWNNTDHRGRHRQSDTAKRSRTALDLHYMISVYGNEVELEPQRLLGSVVRSLSDAQVVREEMIQDTLSDSNYEYLAASDLWQQVEEINFKPMDMSLEDLSKVWSVFFQTPYALSMAYRSTVVMIEGQTPAQKALPVASRGLAVAPFSGQPLITEIASMTGKFEPIVADSTLLIRGKRLQGNHTGIRIGAVEVAPSQVSEGELLLPLVRLPTHSLRAGVQSLQVVHQSQTPTPTRPGAWRSARAALVAPNHQVGMVSNASPFLLRPTIIDLAVTITQGQEEDPRSAAIQITTDVTIASQQQVTLILNERTVEHPSAYLFEAPHRTADTQSITVEVEDVKPGEYFVRIQIDGAESSLKIDPEVSSSTFGSFVGPTAQII